MIKAAELDARLDLAALTRWLKVKQFPHRITEENGLQILWVHDGSQVEPVQVLLEEFLSNPSVRAELDEQATYLNQTSHGRTVQKPQRASIKEAPFVYICVGLSILLALATGLGEGGPLLRSLLIVNPFDFSGSLSTFEGRLAGLYYTLSEGQVWRLLSPDFIHFSILHITFNLLFLWLFGGMIEQGRGTIAFLGLFLFVSIVSNIGQLLASGHLFGGMSGVVYGVLGYCWVWSIRQPEVIAFPNAILKFSIVWLIIGYTPLTVWLGLGAMANTAHLMGLLSGLLWAWLTIERER